MTLWNYELQIKLLQVLLAMVSYHRDGGVTRTALLPLTLVGSCIFLSLTVLKCPQEGARVPNPFQAVSYWPSLEITPVSSSLAGTKPHHSASVRHSGSNLQHTFFVARIFIHFSKFYGCDYPVLKQYKEINLLLE